MAARHTNRRIVLALLVLLGSAAGAAYYAWPLSPPSEAQSARGGAPAARPQPVLAAEVVTEAAPVQLATIGRVQTIASVAVRSRIDGEIAQVEVSDGQEVKAGDVLFVLDSRQQQAMLDQAEATLERDRAQLANAQRDLNRLAPLGQKDFVSKQQLDAARTSVAAAEATVKGDEAQVENFKAQLSYTEIRAPIDGRLGTINQKLGNTVKANDTPPLVTLNQVRPIYVAFSVAERYLPELQKAMAEGTLPATAVIPGNEAEPQQGQVTYLENEIDPATSTISVKASFPNEQSRLWPGQFVNIVVTLRVEPRAIVVPSQAVQAGQNGPFAFVIKPDDTVEVRAVTVDRTLDGKTVIAAGLAPGERVVTDGQMRLAPGTKVEVQTARPAAAQQERSS
jgi:membrane fusion protein, multidrug efflux system